MIDNYDSFTYNLVQYLGELGEKLVVKRNDAVTVADVKRMRPDRIVISPGPGAPKDAGVSNALIRELGKSTPILGVCLGHQCIGEVYGGRIVLAGQVMHGKTSQIHHNDHPIFKGLPNPFTATRYHSLLIERRTFPKCLQITAWTDANEIMGVAHRTHPVVGVQFHPESILTDSGKDLLRNFLKAFP
jgi:anthranilate synthase/aminodeoxychorismate synthase-like glutamine amidotransferase